MKGLYHALVCAIGYAVIVFFGLFLNGIGVYRPENVVLWLLLLWTAYQVARLMLYLRRFR